MKIVKFEFDLFGINTYVVFDPVSKDAIIIDPGMSSEEEYEAMTSFLKRNNLQLTNIVNTHLHIDHAIGNTWTKKEFNVPVMANKDDEFLGSRLKAQAQMFGMTGDVADASIDIHLKDGDEIPVGNEKLKVIQVPGHSPGSIALYDAKDGFLISGDAIFSNSIGRTDLPGGDYVTLINSIKNKILPLPGDTIVYPGHGVPTTVSHEASHNPFLH